MGDVVKCFLKCRQSMHKSFPYDYECKGKTCSAVRLFGKKKKKSQLEIQLLRVFKDMTFLRSHWFKISNTGSWRQTYLRNLPGYYSRSIYRWE